MIVESRWTMPMPTGPPGHSKVSLFDDVSSNRLMTLTCGIFLNRMLQITGSHFSIER